MWLVSEIVEVVNGTPFRVERESFTGISTDSRTIGRDELFIPLPGKNFDGHLYVDTAYERSLGGSLCEKGRRDIIESARGTLILVDDATKALLALARHKRKGLGGTVIAITGSNGKTTTKEILAHILKTSCTVHYNEKNLNNFIGVSKSILSVDGDPEVLVFELGTNSKGEIGTLASLVEPHISLITNVNPSHLEGLSSIEGVLEEKLDLFRFTKTGGIILVNADDRVIWENHGDKDHKVRTFGISEKGDFSLSVVEDLGWKGAVIRLNFNSRTLETRTGLLGVHNLYNILAAAALAFLEGMDPEGIAAAVESFSSYAMRFEPIRSPRGYTVVDDSYNANPSSVIWALRTLLHLPCEGKRVVILGDMKELGDKTDHYHREIGAFLKKNNIPLVLLLGDSVKETFKEAGSKKARLFEDKKDLVNFAKGCIAGGDVILVKGSRAAGMDEIVEALL